MRRATLAGDPAYAETLGRFRAELERWQREIGDLGHVPEDQMAARFRPGGMQRQAAAPVFCADRAGRAWARDVRGRFLFGAVPHSAALRDAGRLHRLYNRGGGRRALATLHRADTFNERRYGRQGEGMPHRLPRKRREPRGVSGGVRRSIEFQLRPLRREFGAWVDINVVFNAAPCYGEVGKLPFGEV